MRSRSRTRGPLAVGVCAALVLAACSRRREPIHVDTIRVAEGALSAPLREAGLDEAALAGAAREALRAAGFDIRPGKRPHRALLDVPSVRLLPAGAGGAGPRVEVSVEIALAASEAGQHEPPRREGATAALPLASAPTPREAWLAAVTQAAQRAAEGIALAIAAEDKPAAELLADLGAKDGRVREQAIRVLGERRSRAAVPALIGRLKEEDPRLVQRVIAALAQIGDERAVPALIEASRGGDAALTARLVRYIGDIGGTEAEGYLLTLESGHPDRRVRKAAREALDEMTARAKEAALATRK